MEITEDRKCNLEERSISLTQLQQKEQRWKKYKYSLCFGIGKIN
jgi:hypothetical protein